MPCRYRPSCQVAPQFGEGVGRRGGEPCHPAELKMKKVLVRSVRLYIGLSYPVKMAGKGKRPENIQCHFCLHCCDLHHRSSNRIGNIVH